MVRNAILLTVPFLVCLGCHRPSRQPAFQTVSIGDSATIIDVCFPSPSIDGMLHYRVIAPKTALDERLPLLYLFHGANSGPIEIMERSAVVKLAITNRLIVVIPEVGFSYYTNAKHKRHSRWEDAMVLDLPRDVLARFPVLLGREHTGVAGISMGGYGASKLALKHPELYSFVGIMSGALDITQRQPALRRWGQTLRIWSIFGLRQDSRHDDDVFYLLDHIVNVQPVSWFESCGKDDPLDSVNARFVKKLCERGIKVDAITTPGGHEWKSWNAAMPQLFTAASISLRQLSRR